MNIDIQKLAKLSKLYIFSEEEIKLENELKNMLAMVENLPELDDESLLDTEHLMLMREDVIEPSMQRAELLSNAPESAAGCVLVPKTVEQ